MYISFINSLISNAGRRNKLSNIPWTPGLEHENLIKQSTACTILYIRDKYFKRTMQTTLGLVNMSILPYNSIQVLNINDHFFGFSIQFLLSTMDPERKLVKLYIDFYINIFSFMYDGCQNVCFIFFFFETVSYRTMINVSKSFFNFAFKVLKKNYFSNMFFFPSASRVVQQYRSILFL